MMRTFGLALVLFLALPAAACRGSAPVRAEPGPPVGLEAVTLRAADRVRLAEAFRLAEQLRDSVWVSWSQAPLAVLLVTPEHEFLLRHPQPADEFRSLGYDSLLRSEVHVRPRQFPPNLLASFPAVAGVATIVIGQPENTDRRSTAWVLTLLHEHFHQLQSSRPGYYTAVEALDLAGDDRTGMWMLNYAFPYDSAVVQERFAHMSQALSAALEATDAGQLAAGLASFHEARQAFRSALSEADYRYFAFQVWQEGVARYTEHRVARLAAERFGPSPAFLALPDHTSFAAEAGALERGIREGTRTADLGRQRRVAFYPVGAAMALLLDRAAPGWQQRYFAEMFLLDPHFGVSVN